MFEIRQYEENDWENIWRIIEPVFRAGETYAYSPDLDEQEAHRIWVDTPLSTYVAEDENDEILGTYYIKENQPGLGSHVCNCGYIVGEYSRGKGVASEMCIHSQRIAFEAGFLAMQYNLVVSTNTAAIKLWKRHGFEVIGTLSSAYLHKRLGLVDAIIMYKKLKR